MPVRGDPKAPDEGDIVKYVVMLVATIVLGLLMFSADNRQREVEAQSAAFLSVSSEQAQVGQLVTVEITVSALDLQGADLFISYDTSILSFISAQNGVLGSSFSPSPLCAGGVCHYIAVRIGQAFSGDGLLLSLTFVAQSAGASSITLSSVSLSNSVGQSIDSAVGSGIVIVAGLLAPTGPRIMDFCAGWNFVTFRPTAGGDRQIGSIDVDGVELFASFNNQTKTWAMIDIHAPFALWGFTVFLDNQPYIVYVEGTPGDGQLYGYWIQ